MVRTPVWEQTVAELVRERGDALYRYALLLCGDPEDAADLVQDALARTFGRLRNGFTVESAEAYVRRAILNANLDRGRRAQRWRKIAPLEYRPDEVEGPSASTDQRIDLHDELKKLSPRERACVVMRYYDDLKVDDIAARLGISAGAVKRYLSDGLAKMALALAPDHVPATSIDETEAIRQARDRRRPKTVLAGTLGGLAALALVVPLALSALPSSVGLRDAAGGTAGGAADETAESGQIGDCYAPPPALPLQLHLPDVEAETGVAQPIELVLVNDSSWGGQTPVALSVGAHPPYLSITRSDDPSDEVWNSGTIDAPVPEPQSLAPGEGRSIEAWLPALPAGGYSVHASVEVLSADGEAMIVYACPVGLTVR